MLWSSVFSCSALTSKEAVALPQSGPLKKPVGDSNIRSEATVASVSQGMCFSLVQKIHWSSSSSDLRANHMTGNDITPQRHSDSSMYAPPPRSLCSLCCCMHQSCSLPGGTLWINPTRPVPVCVGVSECLSKIRVCV